MSHPLPKPFLCVQTAQTSTSTVSYSLESVENVENRTWFQVSVSFVSICIPANARRALLLDEKNIMLNTSNRMEI